MDGAQLDGLAAATVSLEEATAGDARPRPAATEEKAEGIEIARIAIKQMGEKASEKLPEAC